MTFTMTFLACGTLALATVALPTNTSSTLCLTSGNEPIAVDGIISQGHCFGVFEDVVIKTCAQSNELEIGKVGELTVLELTLVGNQTALDIAQWHKGLEGLDIVWTGARRVVVRALIDFNSLPRFTTVLPVLESPMPAFQIKSKLGQLLVAKKNVAAPDPLIERMIAAISAKTALSFLNYLTGITSRITTRNSIAPDGLVAAHYIESEFKKYGFEVELEDFRDGYNPNVIATLKGSDEPDVIVVVGAHYDSRGRQSLSATDPAPGANDDGSGTSMILQLAKVIHENDLSFKYTLVIGSWGGEEQGLVGSRAYAQKCKARGDNILAMLQADMIAFRSPSENIQCGFPDRYSDQLLTDLAMETMGIYTPEVQTCYTSVCCSDHQSFYEQGFSATQFFERCGPINDDQYHNAGDVVNRPGYDVDGTLVSLSRAVASVALTLLEIVG